MLKIYAYGKCLKNFNEFGGWAICLLESGKDFYLVGSDNCTTNNKMEMTAVIEGISCLKKYQECIIYTDSKLVVNCATDIQKRKINLDLWQKYDIVSKNKKINFELVKDNSGNKYNEIVYKLAYKEAVNICTKHTKDNQIKKQIETKKIKPKVENKIYNINLIYIIIKRDEPISVVFPSSKNINRDIVIHYICKCGNQYNKNLRKINEKSGMFCKKCTFEKGQEKGKVTSFEKYGKEYYTQTIECKKRYKETCNSKYGCNNVSQNINIQKKKEETCLKNHGVNNPGQSLKVQEKMIETNMQKRGVPFALQCPIVRQKGEKTCLERLGVRFSQQNPEVRMKTIKNTFKTKKYTFKNGTQRLVQGDEHFALKELEYEYKLSSDKIITDNDKVPRIIYNFKDREHYYYVDIYIPSMNKMIEVKSDYFYEKDTEKIHEKAKQCVKEGYLYELWMYTGKKGKKIKIITEF